MFGKILGRFYLGRDLGLSDDDTHGYTISELVETFPAWSRWISQLPPIPSALGVHCKVESAPHEHMMDVRDD